MRKRLKEEKKRQKQIEKQFVVDNGFLLACNDSNKIFVAHALENLVYNELNLRTSFELRLNTLR